nr:MAG TPA: hypothetical protein [Caudoviricetes sp.]
MITLRLLFSLVFYTWRKLQIYTIKVEERVPSLF